MCIGGWSRGTGSEFFPLNNIMQEEAYICAAFTYSLLHAQAIGSVIFVTGFAKRDHILQILISSYKHF